MNRIEKMIKEMCPNGVKLVKLCEVCTFTRGRTITAKNAIAGNVPVIAGGQTPSYYHNESNRTGETITVAGSGAYAGFVSFWNIPIWVSDAFSVDASESILTKYAYYFLKQNQDNIFATQKGAGVPHVHGRDIENFQIPLPPLPVQQEIVKILDSFTALQQNLEDELKLRQKQYEHYREKLLTFEDGDVEWKKLGEVCNIKGRIGFRGYTREDQVKEGEGALALSPANIEDSTMTYENNTFITWDKYNESPEIMTFNGDIIFCKTGSTVGKVAFVSKLPYKATINPQLVVLKDIMIESKYLYYILRGFRIQRSVIALAGVGSVPNISQAKLSNLLIPITSKETQLQITQTLDHFESLISNLKTEIELRKKQYEYYREKLLTF